MFKIIMNLSLLKILFVFSFLLHSSIVHSQEIKNGYIQKFGDVEINWTDNFIKVKSIGFPSDRGTIAQKRLFAQRIGKLNAQKKLLDFINNIKISSELVIKDVISEENIKNRLANLIRETKDIEINNLPDGSVEINLKVNLFNQSGREINKNILNLNNNESIASIVLSEKIIKSGKKTDLKPLDTKEKYTGLIIDCRDLKINPALLPSIVDEKNNKVYLDIDNFDLNNIINFSSVSYYNSFSEAKKSLRVGENPLVVKPLKVSGEYKTDLVIQNETVKKILGSNLINKFLNENRVIILL
jgi:hypothetical protein